jgi:hypothetical protein
MNQFAPVLSVGQIRMLEIADKIEKLDKSGFDLSRWYHPNCGTPACIAGHAIWEKYRTRGYSQDVCETWLHNASHASEAADYFEIDTDTAVQLFMPLASDLFPDGIFDKPAELYLFPDDYARSHVTGKWAAATLRHLVRTGEVNWQVGRES